MIQLLLFIISTIISFFILYYLSKHDFVLLRKNISTPEIFDQAFISIFLGFLVGRIFYLLDTFKFDLLNPIIFFHLLRFPGFVFYGFFLGIGLMLFILFRNKNALLRIYDIFSLSLFPFYSFSLLIRKYPSFIYVFPFVFFAASVLVFYFLIKSHNKYAFKDGGVTLLFLILISLDIFTYSFFGIRHVLFILSFSQIMGLFTAVFSIILFLIRQKRVT